VGVEDDLVDELHNDAVTLGYLPDLVFDVGFSLGIGTQDF
jgi:hypothetical protein